MSASLLALGMVALPGAARAQWDVVDEGEVVNVPNDKPSPWEPATGLVIGRDSSGTVEVTDGAILRNGFAMLAIDRGSSGKVVVTGPGSFWDNYNHRNYEGFRLGNYGAGEVLVADGGRIITEHRVLLAADKDASG